MGQITHEDLNLKLSEEINKSTTLSKDNEVKIQEQVDSITEVNQKIVNLQQTVTEDKQVVTEHLDNNERHLQVGERTNWNAKTDDSKIASRTVLGHIKVGTNLSIEADGTLNASGGTPPDASTTQKGVTQLNDALNSSLTTQAATANAVKQVNDKLITVENKFISDKVAIGKSSDVTGAYAVALGAFARAMGKYSVAIGVNSVATNDMEGILGDTTSGTNKWIVQGSFSTKGTKNFEIPHPHPDKEHTHILRHGAVESPTTGDTLYRYYIDVKGNMADIRMVGSKDLLTIPVIQKEETFKVSITLPDYWVHLNINDQTYVNADEHFGNGYGKVNFIFETLDLTFDSIGKYSVALYGTRNDSHDSVQSWNIKGAVREIGESWTGETYSFEVDEITEITEFEEMV